MSDLKWIILIAAAVCLYYAVRRWVVLNIFASLVAGTLANPLRAKYVLELMERRDRLDSQGNEKESEQVNDAIGQLLHLRQAGSAGRSMGDLPPVPLDEPKPSAN
jgi:hypothetical protein